MSSKSKNTDKKQTKSKNDKVEKKVKATETDTNEKNKLTNDCQLSINVRRNKKNFDTFFEDVKGTGKDKDGNKVEKKLIIRTSAPVYLTAIIEELIKYTVKNSVGKLSSEKGSNDKKVTSSHIQEFMRSNTNIMRSFGFIVNAFDSEESYETQFVTNEEITDIATSANKHAIVTETGKSMLRFMVNFLTEEILSTSNILRDHVDNLSISNSEVAAALKILVKGDVYDTLKKYADTKLALYMDSCEKEAKSSGGKKKKATKKAPAKNNKNSKAKEESEEEDEDESEDESEDEESEDEESEDEESEDEEEEKPKGKSAPAKGKKK
jgi:hypothetical protein